MSEPLPILIVEDDANLRDAVALTLEVGGYRPIAVGSGPEALAALEREPVAMVLTDLKMSPMNGLEVLEAVRRRLPQLPVAIMTAYGDVASAVAAMRGGACEFLLKPFEPAALLSLVRKYAQPGGDDELVAADPASRQLLQLAERVAQTDATVLLEGESGVGKEVYARFIHRHSPRHDGPFVAINCAAIPEHLLEATLFGHEKGAFTGASTAQPGKFEQAQHGTLLLDEISEMPLALQAKLLRVLQEKEVERLGGRKPIPLDVRILATTNRDLPAEVAAGRFRQDLYYRLAVFPLRISPLRERPGDILPLAQRFLAVHGARFGKNGATLTDEAARILLQYGWPGNVRELENTLQRALILAPGNAIDDAALAACLPARAGSQARAAQEPRAAAVAAPNSASVAHEEEGSAQTVREREREHILRVLREVGGSRKRAVERLGISERTLRYKLQRYRAEGYAIPGDEQC